MNFNGRTSAILISMLIGIGWPLMPSYIGGQNATCTKPANASCADKTIKVHLDGLHGSDNQIFVCRGNAVDWQVDNTEGKVKGFTIHFDETPFHPKFGKGDYCAGANCAGHPSGTDKMAAHTKDSTAGYLRCHKYSVTVMLPDGTQKTIDPIIIVGGTGGGM
jgi:hypothetical protein